MVDFGYGVTLVEPTRDDKLDVLQWRNDELVRSFSRNPEMLSVAEHEDWWLRMPYRSCFKAYIVVKNGERLGFCSLGLEPRDQKAEFSIFLAAKGRGQGLAIPTMLTLREHAFRNLCLWLLWGETFATNKVARSVFERVGFKADGARRGFYYRGGDHVDSIMYSMTADDWKALS